MRIFRSGNSDSQKTLQAVGVDIPEPKSLHRIRQFFHFGRPRKQKPSQSNSSNPIVVLSSSRPSLEPGPSLQGKNNFVVPDDPVSATDPPGNHASPSSQSSQLALSLNTVQTLRHLSPITPPPHRVSPSPSTDPNPGQGQDSLVVPQVPLAPASPLSLHSQAPTIPARQPAPQPWDGNSYQLQAGQDIRMVQESRNVYIDGDNSNVNYTNTVINNTNKFMAELLEKTIRGAAFDSSDRDPPPRCHPGTRLAVIARCLEFIAQADGKKKLRWVVGQAGVGKSAIMQNVAESPLPSVSERASIFLSIIGKNDGAKIIMTLVYQLADQSEPYRQLVERVIARHPALLESSMSVQFKKFIIEPFITHRLSNSVDRILIIIDGLDECDKPETQRELLRLITGVCSSHPSSPIVWIIASRPEHHITSFFAQVNIQEVYEKEEIEVDSDEARSDVERFLRAELTRIQEEFSLSPGSQWPREHDFWKLASASGGLFVYAQTVTKYIGALAIGDPISQLDDVLKVIDALPLSDVPRAQHPLALLDALYARILEKVPERIMMNTRKILLALVLDSGSGSDYRKGGFLVLCNWLGITCDEAYAAIRHLGSVLDIPTRYAAHKHNLRPFHKSFIDYLSDVARSGFSSDIKHEAYQFDIQYAIRILEQAPGGIDCSDLSSSLRLPSGYDCGTLACVPRAGSNIMLSWSAHDHFDWSDKSTRLEVYKWACSNVVQGIKTGQSVLRTRLCIHTIITQLLDYASDYFPWQELITLVFEKSRRDEFIKSGILTRVPVQELDYSCMTLFTKMRFRRPSGTLTHLSDPWNPSCGHKRAGDWGEGKDEDWTTNFSIQCRPCRRRLEQQLDNWKTRSLDNKVTISLTSTEISFLEFDFVDPDDGVSEWTYWIMLKVPKGERRRPGTTL